MDCGAPTRTGMYNVLMNRFLILLPIVLLSCMSSDNDQKGLTIIILHAGDEEIPVLVEIADDPDEQQIGLMHRMSLPEDQGMLFIFSRPQILSFWMKNTLIPLDILFFDSEGKFINVQTMDPCNADPCRTYSSSDLATFALELSAGFYERKLQPPLQQREAALMLQFPAE